MAPCGIFETRKSAKFVTKIGSISYVIKLGIQHYKIWNFYIQSKYLYSYLIARAPAIRKMVIGGRKVAQISFIPSCRGTHWKLENQCLVYYKSCKSVEIMGCTRILLHMTFYNVILENEGVHTKLVISLLLLILNH